MSRDQRQEFHEYTDVTFNMNLFIWIFYRKYFSFKVHGKNKNDNQNNSGIGFESPSKKENVSNIW